MHILAARSKQVAPKQFSQLLAKRSFSSQNSSPIENLADNMRKSLVGGYFGGLYGVGIFTMSILVIGSTESVFCDNLTIDKSLETYFDFLPKSAAAGTVAGAFYASKKGGAALTAITVGLAAIKHSDTIFKEKK